MNIYEKLTELNIPYQELTHKAVYTIEEALKENIPSLISGIECKNLFVKGKEKYYLVVLEASKKADLKNLANLLEEKKLHFADEASLKNVLNLEPGSITPLGIINDTNNLVTVLLDKTLKGEKVLVHPNTNTKTISLEFYDLLSFIENTAHSYILF